MKISPLLLVSSLLLLTACSSFTQHFQGQPTQSNQICKQIKQQIALAEVQDNSPTPQNTPTDVARLYRSYQKYDCAQKLSQP